MPLYQASNDRFDVVCMVRQNMSDETLSQPPLLIYPAQLRRDSQIFLQRVGTPSAEYVCRGYLEPARVLQLEKLSAFLARNYGTLYIKSAQYMSDLVLATGDGALPIVDATPIQPLDFLTTPRNFATLRPQVRDSIVPAVLIPWSLKVTFKRKLTAALRAVRDAEPDDEL